MRGNAFNVGPYAADVLEIRAANTVKLHKHRKTAERYYSRLLIPP